MENSEDHSEETQIENGKEALDAAQEVKIDQEKLNRFLNDLRFEQSLAKGFIGGLLAAIIGAIIWAAITVATGYQIGYMAVAVGFLVGFAVRKTGQGIDMSFGIMGAILALFGCLLGNFLTLIVLIANNEGLGYIETLSVINYSKIPGIMMQTSNPIDLLFYGIAIFEGYKFAFRQITQDEVVRHAAE